MYLVLCTFLLLGTLGSVRELYGSAFLVCLTRWASLSDACERHSCLKTGGGAEDDLLIVTCIHSRLSWVAPVESLDCVFCIVEVFCGVPDFIVFW